MRIAGSIPLLVALLPLACGASKGASVVVPEPPAAATAAPSAPEPVSLPPTRGASVEVEVEPAEEARVETPAKEATVDREREPSKMSRVEAPPSGKLTQDDIASGVSDAEQLFVACRSLGAGGASAFTATVTVKIRIAASGKVEEASVQRSTAKNAKVDRCVADAVRRITFAAAKDGQGSVFTFPIELVAPAGGKP